MVLELNDTIEPYKDFRDSEKGVVTYLAQMPLVIADNRVPLSVANLMERRLRAGKSSATWKDNYFDADGIAYTAGGDKFKIVLDSQDLRKVTPKSKLTNTGALILGDGLYEQLQGQEFTMRDLKSLLERDLSADEAKAHPVWKALARDDALLVEYTDKMFPEMKQKFKYNDAMGLYLASGEKVPTLRAACVGRLGDGSQLVGRFSLAGGSRRVVGVAPEALNAPGKVIERPSLESALSVVNEQLYQGKFELRAKE